MANYKKHDSGWEYRLKYKDPFTGKTREKSGRGFATKKEAQVAVSEFEKKLAGGYEQTDMPLADYLDTWLQEYKTGTVRKNTLLIHQNNIKKHIKPYFKNLMLQSLKPVMYQRFLNHLVDGGMSHRTAQIVHSTMHNAYEKAVTLGKLEKNPCIGVEIKGDRKKRNVKFIGSDDIPKLMQELRKYGYEYWIFFKALLETGMRKGEAAALKWSDISLDLRRLVIDETLDWTAISPEENADYFGDTKTLSSERTIKFSSGFADDLRAHKAWQEQNKAAFGDLYKTDLDLVLCRADGSPMPKSSLFNAFSRCLQRVGLPPLPIHSTRHTFAVLMLEAGVEMKVVQEMLGHGSIQITSDVYAHISKKIEDTSMEKFETFTTGILNFKNSGAIGGHAFQDDTVSSPCPPIH
ncbi:tyrosine-type recombinase/integrase [Paenibacillus pasadenensis]|uniref:site-specific integrase n=1 Tax=Paenibacillus pasadenensis TaxID=217090 RepID=UPI000419D9A2|nr:site-specific integrase [Paenibacillus pasadenensis]